MDRHFADDAELMSEYRARVAADFGGHAPDKFLRELRNYLAHDRLPVAQTQNSFTTDSFTVTFMLLRDPLLEGERWSRGARDWLESQGEQIDIASLIDGYARIADSFDEWLHDRIGRKYDAEIWQYAASARAYNQAVDQAFGYALPPSS
jgi:hypothetical protein